MSSATALYVNARRSELIRLDEAYLPFLSLPDPSSASGAQGDPSDPSRPATGPIAEYDLVPDKVKVTMLLEAAADIKGVERDLREVELLKGRGVEGAGELESESSQTGL